ncbi:nucleophile aminohydrolase [Mucor mucedo]|uniref:nucleophile aminohydrolase n=1 Tax=Mucor mucedo TaxID=29922 RepID=UPI00221F3D10|nr:nucleophile aminohydrolase [Mucor mucedo]KAI7893917.1 nucleophile aminohydrolase [Mucor mucedo]
MHFSAVDKDDGAVSLTSTVNLMFDAKFMDPVTGIILNDELVVFSIPGVPNNFCLFPSHCNYIGPFGPPLFTITPTNIEDEDNNFQLTPRIHHQLIPNKARFETGHSAKILEVLITKGHQFRNLPETGTASASQAIRRFSDGPIHAASDLRKQGVATEY